MWFFRKKKKYCNLQDPAVITARKEYQAQQAALRHEIKIKELELSRDKLLKNIKNISKGNIEEGIRDIVMDIISEKVLKKKLGPKQPADQTVLQNQDVLEVIKKDFNSKTPEQKQMMRKIMNSFTPEQVNLYLKQKIPELKEEDYPKVMEMVNNGIST